MKRNAKKGVINHASYIFISIEAGSASLGVQLEGIWFYNPARVFQNHSC